MVERALDAPGTARAFLRICGSTVGKQQLGVVLALQCERIVCIAPALGPELVELQHQAEDSGARFHVISNHRALAGLVTAADEVIALADGLLVTRDFAAPLLEQAAGVLVQPIEQGLTAGFERIDINTAAAGAMRIPGRLVAQLNDLPADCDAFSTLQRIALQSGIATRSLPSSRPDGNQWTLVASDAMAHQIEPQWIASRVRESGKIMTPGRWIAYHAVRLFGAAILDARSGRFAVLGAVAALAMLGLFAGWYGFTMIGIALVALSWIGAGAHALLLRIEENSKAAKGLTLSTAIFWVVDGFFVVLAGWGAGVQHWQPEYDRFFPPVMLILVLRLATSVAGPSLAAWLSDRLIFAAVLIFALATGFGGAFLHGGAVVLALLGLVASRGFKRIT